MANFIVRIFCYGVLIGIASRLGQLEWTANGLDAYVQLVPLHDAAVPALIVAPIALALVGFGRLHGLCVFAGCFIAGAAITAPFAIARVAGAA
jgi:hypothetical protein